jgi:hypothetical protein
MKRKKDRTPDEGRPSREYREARIRELRGHGERIEKELAATKRASATPES